MWRGESRVVYQGEQGWDVLQSKKESHRVVTKGGSRQGILEWLDGGHWSSCSMALMGSDSNIRVLDNPCPL